MSMERGLLPALATSATIGLCDPPVSDRSFDGNMSLVFYQGFPHHEELLEKIDLPGSLHMSLWQPKSRPVTPGASTVLETCQTPWATSGGRSH